MFFKKPKPEEKIDFTKLDVDSETINTFAKFVTGEKKPYVAIPELNRAINVLKYQAINEFLNSDSDDYSKYKGIIIGFNRFVTFCASCREAKNERDKK